MVEHTNEEGQVCQYDLGPLYWGGRVQLSLVQNGAMFRIEIEESDEETNTFEYLTDEQMQELFLAYIALKEARGA